MLDFWYCPIPHIWMLSQVIDGIRMPLTTFECIHWMHAKASVRTLHYSQIVDRRPTCVCMLSTTFLNVVDDVYTREWEIHLRLHSSRPPHTISQRIYRWHLATAHIIYVCDRTQSLAGWQLWYPIQVPSSPSGTMQPHHRLIWHNSATVIRKDIGLMNTQVSRRWLQGGRERMLIQTLTLYTGQLLTLRTSGQSAQCVVWPWNVTLISPHSSLSLCCWGR